MNEAVLFFSAIGLWLCPPYAHQEWIRDEAQANS